MAVKLDSIGLHAYTPNLIDYPEGSGELIFPISAVVAPRACRWKILICVKFKPSNDDSIRKSGPRRLSLYQIILTGCILVVAQSE